MNETGLILAGCCVACCSKERLHYIMLLRMGTLTLCDCFWTVTMLVQQSLPLWVELPVAWICYSMLDFTQQFSGYVLLLCSCCIECESIWTEAACTFPPSMVVFLYTMLPIQGGWKLWRLWSQSFTAQLIVEIQWALSLVIIQFCVYIVKTSLEALLRRRQQEKKDQWPSLNLGPTLFCEASATSYRSQSQILHLPSPYVRPATST